MSKRLELSYNGRDLRCGGIQGSKVQLTTEAQ